MQKNESIITETVVSLIKSLPVDLQREVGHYAQFIQHRHLNGKVDDYGDWTREEIVLASLPSLWRDWDNDEDATYDKL